MFSEENHAFDDNTITLDIGDENQPRNRSYSIAGWYRHFRDTYGCSVLLLLVFVYFNMGFRVLFSLTMKDLFKHYLKLEPAEAQFFSSIIALPWGLKLFIGIFVDNVKLFGSARNIYLKISGVVMAIVLVSLQMPMFQDKYLTLVLLMAFNIFNAIADVVTDAIMVTCARIDPEHGSSDLQSLHVISV